MRVKALPFILFCWLAPGCLWAQITPAAPVSGGSTVVYSVNNGIVYARRNWVVVGGTVQSTSSAGTTYTATILWASTCTGLIGQLSFRNATTLVNYLEVTVNAPTAATTSASRCGAGSVTLTANPSPASGIMQWYDAAIGGTLLGSGNSFVTPSLSSTTVYYAACYLPAINCEGPRIATTATINSLPSNPLLAPQGSAAVSCGENTFSLTAKFAEANTTFVWYTVAAGGSAFATGTPMSQTISATTTYYCARRSDLTFCESSRVPITITIESPPVAHAVGGAGTYCGTGAVTLANSQSGYGYQLLLNGANAGTPATGNNSSLTWNNLTASGNYTVMAKSPQGRCTVNMSGSAAIILDPTSVGGIVAGSTTVCAPAAGAVTLSGQVGNILRWEQNTGGGWTTLAQTSDTLNFTNLTATTHYRAVVQSGTCAVAYSTVATVAAYASPTVTATGNTIIYGSPNPQLSTGASASYQWVRNGTDIVGATGQSYTVPNFGAYAVRTQPAAGFYCTSAPFGMGGVATAQSQPVNLVSSTVILKVGITDPSQLFSLQPHEVKQVVQYQDGLGRTYQTVAVAQAAGATRGDLVTSTAWGRNGLVDSTFLPYATAVPDGRMRPNAMRANNSYTQSEQYQFYQGTAKVAASQHPFAKTIYRNAPDARVTEQGAPGADWQPGTNHTVRSTLTLNTASYPVKYWKPDGTTTGNYPVRSVNVAITHDENGNQVRTFTDSRGLTVLKQVQEGTSNWLETYSIYDEQGRLKYQVPPKALAVLGSGTDVKVANLAELIYTYSYDSLNRLKEKKVPGAAMQALVYDPLDRVVLTQDGSLRAQGMWMFVKYDQRNRAVYSGLYASTSSRHQLQQQASGINYNLTPWYEVEATAANTYHGYSNQTWPTANLTVMAVSYYDHYDFDRNGTADYTYDNAHLGATPAQASTDTWGKATGSKRALLSSTGVVTTNFLVNVVFYDDYGRTLQTLQNNPLNLAVQDKATVKYDNARRVERTKQIHSGPTSLTVEQSYAYDHASRTTAIYHSINGAAPTQVAGYTYNALGQVVDKQLHVVGGLPLQSVDLRYNIRGWLRSVNNSQLAVNGDNDDANDYFGMELHYSTVESGLANTPSYNGNISAVKWKGLGTAGASDQRSYKYTYDMADRLKTATFAAHNGTAWAKEAGTLDENMTYDANGNVATLVRYQNNRGLTGTTVTSLPMAVDQLTYTYTTNTNRLLKVEDAMATTAGVGDFKNGSTAATEYTYNADGSMAKDLNKGIQTITYNMLGKPQVITYSGTPTKTVTYTYDATGAKIKTVAVANGVTTTTDYVGGFVYTNNALSFFSSPEGRVVKKGSTFEYEYAITDHQGNTRVLFTSAPQAAQPTASNMEAGTNPNFQNYNNMVGFDLFDHTDAGTVFQYSQKLTGGNNAQVGLAKTYNVMAGDKVKIELFAKYFNPQSTSSNLTGFATALASAFGVSAASTGEALKAYNGLNNYGGLVAAGTAHNDNGFPRLFVNILLFDKNYVLIDAAWQQIDGGEQPVGNGTKLPHDFMSAELTAREPGFAYVYFSNESATLVEGYFDDVTMTYTPGNILQYNEYYPFGLQTANSWTRENTTGNNFLFNGGTELNSTTGVYDLHYRNYDPVLGRMTQVDPVAGKYASLTPYNYAFNSPANLNDPLGDEPPFFNREAWRGNMRGGAVYPRGGRNGMDDADWGNSGSLSAGAFAAADNFFAGARQTPGIMEALKKMFSDANFGKGGSNGFYIRIRGIDYSTENLTPGLDVKGLATVSIRDIYVTNITLGHFNTMTNSSVQAIHQGQRDFMNNPFGGALMAFLSGAPLGGTGAILGRVMSGLRTLSPYAVKGGQAAFSAARGYASSLKLKSAARNMFFNIMTQGVTKQNFREIDLLDIGLSALGGNGWGQVTTGAIGGLFDFDIQNRFVSPFEKGGFQLGTDVVTGVVFGASGMGLAKYASPAWQNGAGFLNQLGSDALVEVLTMK
jgi:RHS repeat-associated protein